MFLPTGNPLGRRFREGTNGWLTIVGSVDYPALVFLATVTFLGTISLIAVLIPAVRGANVDSMAALRYE